MNLSCQHVMKVFPIITIHYRNSICTITVIQTTLTYVIETTYSRDTAKCGGMNSDRHTLRLTIYSNIINLSWYIGSISSRPLLEKQRSVRITDGKANFPVSWGSSPSYLTIEGVVTEYKVWLCINLSSDRKVMLKVRVYIYTIATSNSLIKYHPRALRTKHNP
jgi:hypothetical protein